MDYDDDDDKSYHPPADESDDDDDDTVPSNDNDNDDYLDGPAPLLEADPPLLELPAPLLNNPNLSAPPVTPNLDNPEIAGVDANIDLALAPAQDISDEDDNEGTCGEDGKTIEPAQIEEPDQPQDNQDNQENENNAPVQIPGVQMDINEPTLNESTCRELRRLTNNRQAPTLTLEHNKE